jgi:large subunit ribosomal protein L33
MAKKGNGREMIRLKSQGKDGIKSNECYWTVKNKRNTTGKLELMKYDKSIRAHVLFKEAK